MLVCWYAGRLGAGQPVTFMILFIIAPLGGGQAVLPPQMRNQEVRELEQCVHQGCLAWAPAVSLLSHQGPHPTCSVGTILGKEGSRTDTCLPVCPSIPVMMTQEILSLGSRLFFDWKYQVS